MVGGNLRPYASQISPPRSPARTVAIVQGTTVNPPEAGAVEGADQARPDPDHRAADKPPTIGPRSRTLMIAPMISTPPTVP